MLQIILQSFLVGYAIQPDLESGYKVLGGFVVFGGFCGVFVFLRFVGFGETKLLGLVLGFFRVYTFGV